MTNTYSKSGIKRAIEIADSALPDCIQVLKTCAIDNGHDMVDRIKSISLLVKFLEVSKELMKNSMVDNIPIEKLMTRDLLARAIPDFESFIEKINGDSSYEH